MSAGLNRPSYISPSRNIIKTIHLHDWWLINGNDESNNRLLRVAGIGSKDGKLRTVFFSAAISKRHDMVTLETIDGFTVTLTGSINRSATRNNGFSVEVCNCFQFGFPSYWKDYASFEESSCSYPLPMTMDDIPVSLIRDNLVLGLGGSSVQMKFVNSIFDDLVQNNGDDITQREDVKVQKTVSRKNGSMKSGQGRVGSVMTRSMLKQKRNNASDSDSKCDDFRKGWDEALLSNNDGVEEIELGMSAIRRSSRLKSALRKKL
ncbi:protein EMBRYO DEFECTIVE 1674 [Impatiens glandulifera]|uniref:protein EMBRYO DEFECTIVE 1674 n=1 Tax=Impatiens glandulifera TaxID=253017 RepID=UPI001FB17A67|nr:protein EMBRYO DEFECTIVE 1674 [Impatiens glandulifera]